MFFESRTAVIADDLTGAAEIGGAALVHGIPAEIHIGRPFPAHQKLIVVDTDTRCRTGGEAMKIVEAAAAELHRRNPERRIFKKVDSLLRGNVVAELTALMKAINADRILLAPANPALGRTIRSGTYFVQGLPIADTEFARDPRHPVSTSSVLEMLAPSPEFPLSLAFPGQPLPSTGIAIAETTGPEDLCHWAEEFRGERIWAGGAAFFAALLQAQGYSAQTQHGWVKTRQNTLLVSGSASQVSRSHLQSLSRAGVPVIGMPLHLLTGGKAGHDASIGSWAAEIAETLAPGTQVAITIGKDFQPGEGGRLAGHLAEVVQAVLELTAVGHLWVEGGETASRIVRHLGWQRLEVLRQILPGVVELKPQPTGPILTVKPGSYPWPQP
jgi:D-threonate/D-erythronate kinase